MKKKYESYINEALNVDLKTVEDPELLNMVVAKIIAIHKNDPEYKPSLPDDTAYYIYLVICALSEGGYYRYIETAYSDKTPDAFNEIGASEYANLFAKFNKALFEESNKVKGLFKGFRRMKILRKHTYVFKEEWEKLDTKKPLIPTYVNPYLKKKVIPVLEKYQTK
ncbi:MAG: hypothetical protein E7184_01790 [Erysipelotrichaceae bacterium]|nr:hypothetical protein [Erysipelotrichaceae bacterium]